MAVMTTRIGSSEAARLLGVTKPTLYAYVSRGVVGRTTAVDGRTSLFDRTEIDRLAARSRVRGTIERPTIDVQIGSAITHLSDDGITYRGHDVARLAAEHGFESVVELLISGELPVDAPRWPLDRAALQRCRAVIAAAGPIAPTTALALAAGALIGTTGQVASPSDAARRLLSIAPSLLGGPVSGTVSERLTAAWRRHPSDELVDAVSKALVLLADHELATSTLAVRVACSVRADPHAAIAAGLHTVSGALHGSASQAVGQLFEAAAEQGAEAALSVHLDGSGRVPGFGHSVYRNGDPRFEPLISAVRRIPVTDRRREVVDAVLAESGRRVSVLPNVDLALGALLYVGRIPLDAPLFAIARIAGWAAHYAEEADERPLRYRGLARPR
jgi:citrate synthase